MTILRTGLLATSLLLLGAHCTRLGFSPARDVAPVPAPDRPLLVEGRSADTVLPADSSFCTGAALTGSPYAGGDGTAAAPFTICTAAQLAAMPGRSADLDKAFALMADLDFAGVAMLPIGVGSAPFKGSFEGNQHTISGLVIKDDSADNRGFFGSLQGTVKRLHLQGLTVSGKSYIGGLAGIASAASVDACSASGSVTAAGPYVGGLIGWVDGKTTISNSSSSVAVTGAAEKVGGLVGQNHGTISRSSASGKVTATRKPGCVWAGGLVGENYGTISRSFATGEVIAASAVGGGLVAWSRTGVISDCYATGNVQVGVAGGNVPGCTVDGAGGYGGGLLGVFMQGVVERSYATGNVTVTGTASGGLIALQFVGIGVPTGNPVTRDSFATGTGKAADSPGGLLGGLVSGTQVNNYWDKAKSQIGTMCQVAGAAGCDDTHGVDTSLADKATYFQSKANAPLSSWDFISVWQESPGGYPRLR